MKNLPVVIFIPSIGIKILILVLFNNILVLFDRSIGIPRAHARIHKVFYPCNRCHLATLSDNQYVTCGNEVTRVTTNDDFALNIHSTQRYRGTEFLLFLCVSVSLCLPKYSMWVAKISQFSIPPHGTNRKVPPSKGEGAGFKGRLVWA